MKLGGGGGSRKIFVRFWFHGYFSFEVQERKDEQEHARLEIGVLIMQFVNPV